MAAFSYQHLLHHPFLFDSIFFPGTPTTTTNNSHFSQSHFPTETLAHQMAPVESAIVAESSSCIDQSSTKVATFSDNETSVTKKQSPESSAVVDKLETGEQVTQKVTKPMEKKRRTRNGPSAQSKAKKHKKVDVAKTHEDEKELQIGSDGKEVVKAVKEVDPPTGYIHVRARRGQATDSHSLAERVRREKISERMKMLQRLVPGCDKVTGRAVMLDEIINYVQSLQNQVEFLSMKLASVNSPYYGFGTDIGDLMVKAELPEPFSTGPQCSPTQPPTVEFADTCTNNTTTFTTACDNYPFLDSLMLQQAPRPNTFHQDSESSIMWDMEDQRQSFLNPSGFNNNNLHVFFQLEQHAPPTASCPTNCLWLKTRTEKYIKQQPKSQNQKSFSSLASNHIKIKESGFQVQYMNKVKKSMRAAFSMVEEERAQIEGQKQNRPRKDQDLF